MTSRTKGRRKLAGHRWGIGWDRVWCECGATSGILPNHHQQENWYRQHVIDIRMEADRGRAR